MKIALALFVALLCGCSTHKSTVIRRVQSDGSVTEITRSATRTLFDADSKLVNNRVESITPAGSQTISIGTLSQQTSGSNAVQFAKEVEKIKNSVPASDPLRDALRKVIGQ
jgi:hypothetical protein